MPMREGVAGTGLQVAFKVTGECEGFEGGVELDPPWRVFRGVRRFAGIVILESLAKIFGVSDVALDWMDLTFEDA